MEQEKVKNLEEGIMDILKGIHKILGIDGIAKSIGELHDVVKTLNTELSKKAQISELEELKSAVAQIKERIDTTQGELQSLHIREESDYTTAIEHFIKLNDSIGSRFKKDDKLRYLLFDLLVYNEQDAYKAIDNLDIHDDETLNTIYNLKKEIMDFHKKQVGIINKKISENQTGSCHDNTYTDAIIYPRTGEKYNNKIHDNIAIDEGDRISKTVKLGYYFPNYEKKAFVTLKKLEEYV